MKREPKIIPCSNAGCKGTLKQFNSLVNWCSPKCGYELSQLKVRQKNYIESINGSERRKTVESVSHQHELTQPVFNAWVRMVKDKGAIECISCQRPRGAFTEHCGHFKTVGSAGILRYFPDNGNLQCYRCNVELSGNIGPYREALIAKIGIERVEFLESEAGKPYKWRIAELKDLRFKLNKEIREAA